MSWILRLLALIALLAGGALLNAPAASAGHCFVTDTGFVVCTEVEHIPGSGTPGGPGGPGTPDPTGLSCAQLHDLGFPLTTPCWRVECTTLIENDLRYPELEVRWNRDARTQPFLDYRDPLRRLGVIHPDLRPVGASAPLTGLHFSETGHWWRCDDVNLGTYDPTGGPGTGPTFGPTDGYVDGLTLIHRAQAKAQPPDPVTDRAPPRPNQAIAKMPTWFWLEPSYYRVYQGSDSSSSGRIRVEVTADPVTAIWQTGEGPLECSDGGMAYAAGIDPEDPRGCIWEYFDSSSVIDPQGFLVTTSASFDRSWLLFGPGGAAIDGGFIDTYTVTTDERLVVGELQALGVSQAKGSSSHFGGAGSGS